MTTKEEQIEQKKRVDMVIGIVIASVFGLGLNLISSIYYDLFVSRTVVWADMDHNQVFAIIFLMVASIGFLDFFIHDYKNNLEVNKSLVKRFLNYFFYEFTPGKILRVISGLYMILVLVGLLILLYIYLVQSKGFVGGTALFSVGVLLVYLKNRLQKIKR